ncbi:hypothetical protein PVK06_016387 [Gossypium arboreum]|uniref:Reverse transcriptase Ty1/copia-type domain-containing protein n=1 Tax=Gossypium arboreum TaxID=29729 RepID=A0ABR0PZU1_GOSAR|nr:hypothetical protein PVK06_016387 [Gossypium arboreum]
MVCRLQKSLYRLKQAFRQWNIRLTKALLAVEFTQSKYDYSLFTKRVEGNIVVLLVYVDDLLIAGNDINMIRELKGFLNTTFKMKDLGDLRYFIGIEVLRFKEGIVLSQKKYAHELIEDTGLKNAKIAAAPLEQNLKLTTVDYDKDIQSEDALLENKTSYQRLIGRLIYLTHTRPDIVFAMHYLSQFMQQPKRSHLEAAMRVVRYIKKDPGQGLLFKAGNEGKVVAFCDSDWAACPMTRRSVTGYCIMLGSSLISWKSKKQSTVAKSSAEAEYRSMAAVTAEIVWLTGLLQEIGMQNLKPVELCCDSKASIQIAANPVYHERTKHIEIDCHFVREKIQDGLIQTKHVSTTNQLADIMSKALGSQQHNNLM